MFNPSYLTLSRHGVFYFRWPLPRALHPSGKIVVLKVSLRTRDPKRAIRLSRHLGYVAQLLVSQGTIGGMDFDQIRALLTEHFKQLLAEAKSKVAKTGRLNPSDKAAYANSAHFAQEAVSEGWPLIPGGNDTQWMSKFIKRYDLSLQPGTDAYNRFRAEAVRAHRDFCSSMLDYDRSLENYDFTSAGNTEINTEQSQTTPSSRITLVELASRFTAERNLGKQWVLKTQMEKAEHIALLKEILGENTDVLTVTSTAAQQVKQALTHYPKNRKKNPITRDLSLEEILKLNDVPLLNVRTLNKYIQTYVSMFGWAKRNSFVQENPFEGLSVRQGKNKGRHARSSFSKTQVERILDELVVNRSGLVRLSQLEKASDMSVKKASDLLKDGAIHEALRAVAAIYVGRYGDHSRRKALVSYYGSVSPYIQSAIYFSSRNWPGAERSNAKASWGSHGLLNSLLTIAMTQK